MGTSVPAPACLAKLSNTPIPVSSAVRKIRVTETAVPASSRDSPIVWYQSSSPCPITQISPPTRKAHTMFFPMGEGLALLWT